MRNIVVYVGGLTVFFVLGFFITGYWLISLILILTYLAYLRMVYVDDQESKRVHELAKKRVELMAANDEGDDVVNVDIHISEMQEESFIEEHSVIILIRKLFTRDKKKKNQFYTFL